MTPWKVVHTLIVSAALSSGVEAATLYSQALNLNGEGGPFSYKNQQIADEFKLAAPAALSDLIWYGDNFANSFAPTQSFTIRLFNDLGTVPANNPFVDTPVIASITDTGNTTGGSKIFRFSASLTSPVALSGATDYWLSILDTTTVINQVFRWANGSTTSANDDRNVLRATDGVAWTPLGDSDAARFQSAYDLLSSSALVIPEPGSLLIVALGLLLLGQFRRSGRV